ncbi:MAG: phosphatase PAP2 family protein [Planctomycetota bacterium]|nr:phosphatase PAP2 family protein [Planctomycetota bacterium]
MRFLTPHDRRVRRRRRLLLAAAFLLGLIVLTLLDRAIFEALRVADRPRLERRDWYQFLRALGYAPTWIAVGAVLIACDAAARRMHAARPAHAARRGALTILGALLGGGLAELLKVVVARQRPINNGVADGAYVWGYPFEALAGGGNYGLASSHAGVAFGAAFVLARVAPGSGWVLIPLAIGCGVSRLLTGAHFATDVYVAAWLSGVIAAALCGRFGEGRAA